MSAETNPETAGGPEERIDPSQISPLSGESIVSALVWAWRASTFYRQGLSEHLSGTGSHSGRAFDDVLGEYEPSESERQEAAQDIWMYAINEAGVTIEDMYKLEERAEQIMEAGDLARTAEEVIGEESNG